jgi:hypothetical protein
LNLNPPRYRTPSLLYQLRVQLKDKIDQLSEQGVCNILDAYEELPRDFPGDLLDEIKEMVLITIQHNNANIKSFFLLDFLERCSRLKRNRRLQEDKLSIVLEEIARRLPNDDFLSRTRTIERLAQLQNALGSRNDILVKAIQAKLLASEKPIWNTTILQTLIRNQIDVSPILDKVALKI